MNLVREPRSPARIIVDAAKYLRARGHLLELDPRNRAQAMIQNSSPMSHAPLITELLGSTIDKA